MSKELDLAKELVKMLEEKENQQEIETVESEDEEEKVELSTLHPGEIFKIGEHDFIVLEQNELEAQTCVISKGFMAEDVVFDADCRDYNKSKIRRLIESDIQPIIEKEVGIDNLVQHSVDLTSVDMQSEFCSLNPKVRLITFDEARKYNDLLVNKDLDDWWWTLTPWSTAERGYKYALAFVSPSGLINYDFCDNDIGVRPFCILKSNIFVSKGE